MTKQTYKNNIKKLHTALVEKYGETHTATTRFREQIKIFNEPTDENLVRVRHCYFTLMRYGRDLEEEYT